ncbi:MAG TPA: hypothetical protein VK459_04385 [Polyangiaceae bacterium]|nr:hypothetical protein [Polyangiaceae bacterium]
MRWVAPPSVLALGLLVLAGCDNKPPGSGGAPTSTAAATNAPAAPTSAALAPPPPPPAPVKKPMPPRPVPLGSSGPIQPSAPADQQMMAIQYTLAMVSPQGTDPIVDKAYLEEILKKLEVAVRTADKGNTPANPVQPAKGNRKIEVNMGRGCTERVPSNLVAQRANSSLKAAYEAGILVISCRDNKWECHQSTRDPEDVLCHAAPR